MRNVKLIVGLGNPGSRFSRSRHNVGFRCIDYIAQEQGIKLAERRAKVVLGQGQLAGIPVVLAKPRTFMNLSGEAVHYLLTRFASTPEDLVVIYDEMDLPLGKVRIRPRGSAAGHNGIRSIITTLATQEFPRVRVGISKAPGDTDGMDYVLGPFSHQEMPLIEKATETVAEAVACLLQDGIQTAMNRFN